MPITLAFYLWGFLESFQRDSDRIIESYKRINQSALGVAVLACSSWPLNRERLAELLGFEKPITNGLDAAQISLFDIPLRLPRMPQMWLSESAHSFKTSRSNIHRHVLGCSWIPAPLTALQRCRKNAIPAFSIKLEGQQATLSALCRHLLRAHNLQLGMYDNKESVLEDCSGVFVKGVEMLELMEQAFFAQGQSCS